MLGFIYHGFWIGWLWPLAMLLVFGGLAFWAFRRPPHPPLPPQRGPGMAILEERYARGEITRQELLERRADLMGEQPGG
jgi:putative membrane protein